MADFLSLLMGGLPSIIANFRGSAAPYAEQQEGLAARMAQYGAAMGDPENPLYKKTFNRYQSQNKSNLAQVIAEAQAQNRLANKMGRTPLFSQERGGENLFRTIAQQYQDMGARSDEQTRAALSGASGATGHALQGYNTASPFQAMKNYQQDIAGWQGISNLFAGKEPAQYPGQQQQPVYILPQTSLTRGYFS